jgi:ABC-type branched-subunit amino acid transport system ATPase component
LLVEQKNITAAMTLADRLYVLRSGHIGETLSAQAVCAQPDMLHRHLGI